MAKKKWAEEREGGRTQVDNYIEETA